MGSGKTFWGRRLAETLQCPFYDLDTLIVAHAGKSIPEIFDELGETGFREMERARLLDVLKQPAAVVSTGGGTPCFFDNMEQMNAHARTIYLDLPVHILVQRLQKEMQNRPLLAGLSDETLPAFIEKMLEKRAPFYEKSQQKPEWSGVEAEYAKRLLHAATLNNS